MRFRFWLSIAMLLWAVASRPAQADITADYYVWGTIGPTMKVQVADNGHARVEMGGHLVAIRRDGITYLVHTDEQGAFVVTADEFARIEASLTPDDLFAAESDMVRGARIVEAGTEMVGAGGDGSCWFRARETKPSLRNLRSSSVRMLTFSPWARSSR